jgi:PAS domain S-box-containing protein
MLACKSLESAARLREVHVGFEAILDSVPIMIAYTAADGGCVFANRTWCDFAGRTSGELSADGWFQNVHPDDREVIASRWGALEERRSSYLEIRNRRYDGEYRWLGGHNTARFLNDGTYAGQIVTFEDITDRRRDRENDGRRLAALGAAAGVRFAVCDRQGRVCQPNEWNGTAVWTALDAPPNPIQSALQQAADDRAMVRLNADGRLWTVSPVGDELMVTVSKAP